MPPRFRTLGAIALTALIATPAPAQAENPARQPAQAPARQKRDGAPVYQKPAENPLHRKQADDPGYQKYYVATSAFQGSPETLEEVATRFLGSATRAPELRSLNAGRAEPDGTSYDGRSTLTPGWVLVLPWDAAGRGVQYGLLPKPAAKTTAGNACHPEPPKGDPGDWALSRIHAQPATSGSSATTGTGTGTGTGSGDGSGIVVAIVDSGADPAVPALAGHLRPGANLATGTTATPDCAGTGTPMASIVLQVAPGATLLPIAVDPAGAGQAATGIQVALSSGAQVIALGAAADLTDPAVRAAADQAAAAGTVVVTCPPSSATPAVAGLLRVTPIDALDHGPQTGPADLSAPGVAVSATGPGTAGPRPYTGPQYAVAFVAGAAALVRAAYPRLSGPQTADRLRSTASPMPTGPGVLDAARAITEPLPTGKSKSEWWWWAASGAFLLVAAVTLVLRRRRRRHAIG